MTPIRRRLAAALALAWPALSALASGGVDNTVIVSVPRGQPEPAAVAGYVHGHLGVLWPSYDRPWLMMAYRQAMGHAAMTEADAASWIDPKPEADFGADWLAARHEAGAADRGYAPAGGTRATTPFAYGDNCLPDAYRLAAATLRARRRAHPDQPAAIKEWIAAQDIVFESCANNNTPDPQDLPTGAPAWLRHDRAYQQAATLFYLGQADDASKAFAAIAADADSPWREWASYLLARQWWRSTFNETPDYKTFAASVPDWHKAPMPARLAALSTGARDPEVRSAAAGLLRIVQARLEPVEAHRALWHGIDAAEPPADLDAWVSDERFLWALMKDDDVTDDWLFQTRSIDAAPDPGRQAASMAAAWTRHPTRAWLASTLLAAHPGTPDLDSLVAASRALKPEDPLYLHCTWQRARLAIERRDFADARHELAAARRQLTGEATGTRQAFEQLEMLAAPSLAALGERVQRLPLMQQDDGDGETRTSPLDANASRQPFIDAETTQWLASWLDGPEMLALARLPSLAAPVRMQLAGGAWLRGALLKRDDLESDATTLLTAIANLPDVAAATTPPEQHFRMARHLLLHELVFIGPGAQSDPIPQPVWRTPPAFHDTATAAHVEQARLALGQANQTTWMGQAMLPWLRAHKSAEGPALLEKLVYASRYGEHDTATSRAAFQLLHQQYPRSAEAQRTPYYF